MNNRYAYYDARSVILQETLEEIEKTLKILKGPLEVARFPSGHKVWRLHRYGTMPAIEVDSKEYGPVRIEPSHEFSLESLVGEWRLVE